MNSTKNKLIIWGGTGNFRVLYEYLVNQFNILGYFDRNTNIQKEYNGIPYMGNNESFNEWIKSYKNCNDIYFICSIGPGSGSDRVTVHEELKYYGLKPITAIHPTAFVAKNAKIGEGTQLYAQSAVCADTFIGKACIINTAASVDHDCIIEEGVSIGPGARLAGLVKVNKYADIYTGAVILPRLTIGEGAVVGAGAVVLEDVAPYTTVAGNPAKVLRQK